MIAFWVKFSDRGSACVNAESHASVMEVAKQFGNPISADMLPYPASPQLGRESNCPPFCWSPELCKGRSCCSVHGRSCSE